MPFRLVPFIKHYGISFSFGGVQLATTSHVLITCLAVLALTTACAATSTESHSYKLYPGPEQLAIELATMDISGIDGIIVDGLQVKSRDYDKVLVLPGAHRVIIEKGFGFSVMVEPAMHGSFETSLEFYVEAGRSYKVKSDRTHGHGYRIFFWIEDVDSGDVIAGEKKP
jgi:hypothetical protein